MQRCAGPPDAKPEVIAAYKADIEAISKLYDAARAGDATCDHPRCGGKVVELFASAASQPEEMLMT